MERKNPADVLRWIDNLCEVLCLPDSAEPKAAYFFHKLAKLNAGRATSRREMTAAAVYLASLETGFVRTTAEVTKAAGMRRGSIARYRRLAFKEVKSAIGGLGRGDGRRPWKRGCTSEPQRPRFAPTW